ncbi:MAG: putative acetyltransferase [Cryomorphaceae bacterium]|jgi:putative acetyltransferase
MKPSIRAKNPSDNGDIHQLTREAFSQMARSSHTEQFIVDALREANALTVSLVAELSLAASDSKIIAHVAVSAVTVSDGSKSWYGLGPISVHPDHQGQGVGSGLMKHALRDLAQLGAAGCVLLGDPAFYSRFGFEPIEVLTLAGVSTENFQALLLNSERFPQGQVSYHTAFSATE